LSVCDGIPIKLCTLGGCNQLNIVGDHRRIGGGICA
jgi:hypothetical protein